MTSRNTAIQLFERASREIFSPRAPRLEHLLDLPQAQDAVRSLDPGLFAAGAARLGMADSIELVAAASSEQRMAHLALCAWKKDSIDLSVLDEWIEAFMDIDPLLAAGAFLEWDYSMQVYFLRMKLEVIETDPEKDFDYEGWMTPDRRFFIKPRESALDSEGAPEGALEDVDQVPGYEILVLVNVLYSHDLALTSNLIKASLEEQTTQLLEECHMQRERILQSMGWPDRNDSLRLYSRPQDAVSMDAHGHALARSCSMGVEKAIQALKEAVRLDGERQTKETTYALNALLRFDDVDPGSQDRIASVICDGLGYLTIGLECLSAEGADAVDALINNGPIAVIRTGYCATWPPVFEAAKLIRENGLKAAGRELEERIKALMGHRPGYLDVKGKYPKVRGFTSCEEIVRTVNLIRQAATPPGDEAPESAQEH